MTTTAVKRTRAQSTDLRMAAIPSGAFPSGGGRSSWAFRKGDEIARGRYVVQHLGGGERYECVFH